MNWRKLILLGTLTSLMVLTIIGCDQDGEFATTAGQTSSTGKQTIRPAGWTDKTHGNNVEPDYDVVFPQDKVNQIKITIDPDDWEAMQANMTELYGEHGTQQQRVFPNAGEVRPDRDGMIPGDIPQNDGVIPRVQGIPGWVNMAPENPIWVPATIEFNGLSWTNVGVRYKGNSSLTSGWRNGSFKLPLKFDFDEFEDEYPEIDNQRFYGFKQLSFSNAFSDSTYMRDVIAADILKEAGLVAAETAHYEVIMDYGEGPVNLGLYVVIEVIDDSVIEHFFDSNSGNIYEGDGPGVSLAEGTFNIIEDSFLKENNTDEADWSDIEELYNVLHSESHTSDPETWRENLEAIFDVDTFLEWLAISAIIQHWDSYGLMLHNFYLYHNPDTGLLTWISWDHNQVLAGGIGARAGRAIAGIIGRASTMSLNRDEVTEQWPLIRYLLDDTVYYGRYTAYIKETIEGAFNPNKIEEKCHKIAELIAPYVVQDSGASSFELAIQELIDRIYERFEVATNFLAGGI